MPRPRHLVAVILVALLSNAVVASAQDARLSDDQVKERLAFITKALGDGQPGAQRWYYGWIGAYSAGAVTMGILAATNWKSEPDVVALAPVPPVDNGFAQDMLVGGATFALGVVGLAINPFSPATAARKLRPLAETTPLERGAKLKRAEELLRECARREKDGRSAKTHLLNLGANAAAGVVTAAAFKRPWTDGLITFATGEAISLLNIFTQPMRATRDLKKYEAGSPAAAAGAVRRASWSLSVWPGGVGFELRF